MDINIQKSYDALASLMKKELSYPSLPDEVKHWVWQFETGQMPVERFIWQFQHLCPKPTPQGFDIVKAWNAMLLGWDPRLFDFLTSLRARYKLYLLSNTNALHIEWVHQDLKNQHGIKDFETRFFDKAYYSHEIGLHKPDRETYNYVLRDAGILPEETIFIDDALPNIREAAKLGIHVYHHDPKNDLIEIFEKNVWWPYGK